MKIIFALLFALFSAFSFSQSNDTLEINQIGYCFYDAYSSLGCSDFKEVGWTIILDYQNKQLFVNNDSLLFSYKLFGYLMDVDDGEYAWAVVYLAENSVGESCILSFANVTKYERQIHVIYDDVVIIYRIEKGEIKKKVREFEV